VKKSHPRAVIYLPEALADAVRAEADRLNKPISWVVQECVSKALPRLKGYPSPDDIVLVGSDERKRRT